MPNTTSTYEPLVLVDTADLPEEEWLEYRRRGIGGCDAAAILGVSPFATARDLYYDKLKVVSYEDGESNWVQKKVGHYQRLSDPPFSEECEHIKRAFDFVRPGGSLVAVCSSSIQWKSTRKYEQFRGWLSEHTHSINECGAKFEMTGVHTVVLVMDKAA